MCHYTNKHNDSFVTQCCKNKDYCNRDLRPVLSPPKNPGRVTLYFLFYYNIACNLDSKFVF